MVVPDGMVAHVSVPGAAPLVAVGLFFTGMGAAAGSFWFSHHESRAVRRAAGIGLGVVAVGCFGVATAFPFLIHLHPQLFRPASSARLEIVSPAANQEFRGDPATIPIQLRLDGGTIVPFSSTRLVPNEGHIHVYLDGRLVSMTGLEEAIDASPGTHTLRAEFVAADHGPFSPRVTATVTFEVRA